MLRLFVKIWLSLLLVPTVALASNLECYEEEGTMSTMCIQPSAVRANGDIRSSPLFMGGPKSVSATSFMLITNCTKSVTTLQDREGKNFAGGRSNETKAVRSLSSWVCAVKSPRNDSTLRQF